MRREAFCVAYTKHLIQSIKICSQQYSHSFYVPKYDIMSKFLRSFSKLHISKISIFYLTTVTGSPEDLSS